ncbi:hypothetical protein I4U23_023870 [Adineta vaga]|nr:hypothetical protein I4U23_023870 [Adineta vaga]
MERMYNKLISVICLVILFCFIHAEDLSSMANEISTDWTSAMFIVENNITTEVTDNSTDEQTSNTIFETTTELITKSTTVIDTTTRCGPGQFPFANGCMSPDANGAVLITALILSIISFIGVIAAGSYLLWCRKYIAKKKRRLVASYNISTQDIVTMPTRIDTERSSLSSNDRRRRRRGSLKKQPTHDSIPLYSMSPITAADPNRVEVNVLDKQPVLKMAKVKQRDRIELKPTKNQGYSNTADFNDSYF